MNKNDLKKGAGLLLSVLAVGGGTIIGQYVSTATREKGKDVIEGLKMESRVLSNKWKFNKKKGFFR
jgi:hypothetical protein